MRKKTPEPSEPALPLPFFIRFRGENWMELLGKLESSAKEEVNFTSEDDHALIQVQVQNWGDYEALSPLLEEYIVPAPEKTRQKKSTEKTPRKKATVKALLRGLPWLCSADMVCTCLTQAGFGNVAVRLHNKSNRRKPPLFILVADADGDGEEKKKGNQVFELSKLLGFPVLVEPLPAGLDPAPQCYKCQEEGHVAKYCRNRAKCVKCAGEHASHACPLARDVQPTCARCRGPHVASWRGCPIFQDRSHAGEKRQQNARPTAEGPAKKRRRRRRAARSAPARSAPAPSEQRAAPFPAARPAATAIGERGGGGGRKRGGASGQSVQDLREEQDHIEASDGAHSDIDAALEIAESRMRAMLQAELEAACSRLRRSIHQKSSQKNMRDAQTGTDDISTPTDQLCNKVTQTPKKRLLVPRAVQTRTQMVDFGCQMPEITENTTSSRKEKTEPLYLKRLYAETIELQRHQSHHKEENEKLQDRPQNLQSVFAEKPERKHRQTRGEDNNYYRDEESALFYRRHEQEKEKQKKWKKQNIFRK